jgi:hypothetical protein
MNLKKDQHLERHPPPRFGILRPCRECGAPMLLMSALTHSARLITKRYECYVCKKTEEITSSVN